MSSRLRSSTRASTLASDSLAEIDTKTKSESRTRTAHARPLKASERHRVLRIVYFAFVFSLVVIAGVIYFALNDTLKLYPASIQESALQKFSSKAEVSLRYQTLLYLWLVFNVWAVMYVRISRSALNPLVESTEKHVQMSKNILTNSFEQIVLSSLLQLTFVSFADARLVIRLIPAVNVVQFFGRIAFFLGYPYYRTLGVSLTAVPNLLLVGFNVYKLGSYVGFY